jgi:hypothetical protein
VSFLPFQTLVKDFAAEPAIQTVGNNGMFMGLSEFATMRDDRTLIRARSAEIAVGARIPQTIEITFDEIL